MQLDEPGMGWHVLFAGDMEDIRLADSSGPPDKAADLVVLGGDPAEKIDLILAAFLVVEHGELRPLFPKLPGALRRSFAARLRSYDVSANVRCWLETAIGVVTNRKGPCLSRPGKIFYLR
jgi:hypothetical protein